MQKRTTTIVRYKTVLSIGIGVSISSIININRGEQYGSIPCLVCVSCILTSSLSRNFFLILRDDDSRLCFSWRIRHSSGHPTFGRLWGMFCTRRFCRARNGPAGIRTVRMYGKQRKSKKQNYVTGIRKVRAYGKQRKSTPKK